MRLRTIVAYAAVFALSACTSMPPDLAASGALRVESVDSRHAHVGQVRVRAIDDERLKVSGYLRKRSQPHGAIPGWLHAVALDSEGAVVGEFPLAYHRRKAGSARSYFSHTLRLRVANVYVLRLVHHGLGESIE